ncbi:sugar ABC transporter permease [Streptomyces sp. NPDC089919]|uniref:sugar ABC transporter permease n=1 Tax=Streptomyces sp. NPDC089919 TaxID=3155188 RepID=UPI0034473A92
MTARQPGEPVVAAGGPDRAPDWAREALELVLARVAGTAAEVGTRFPLYAEPGDGRWTSTGRGSWTGGFWAGLLWLRARHTGRPADAAAARAATARLAPWAAADTAARGLILWYGTALAPAGDGPARALRERAARAALADFDPELGAVPWGAALGGPRLLARVDGVPGLVPLLASAGPAGAAAGAAHLARHLALCNPAGAERPVPAWQFTTSGWCPLQEPAAGWARGEAWLLLALADASLRSVREGPTATGTDSRVEARTPVPVADREPDSPAACSPPALRAETERLLRHGPLLAGPPVPPADAGRPDGPPDTSAAAIAALALLKLARVPGPRAREYRGRAEAVLHRLVSHHLTTGSDGRPPGMLLDGCYDAATGTAPRHELVWGTFFLALALAVRTGLADAAEA